MLDFRNIKDKEKDILDFWKSHKIYRKSVKKNSSSSKKFYMMDGPPYATGHIHMGTALNKILKDIAMRSRRLRGFEVFDRAGYDTHGVPIELQIEKEIGSKGKQDIEKFGVDKFVAKCKEFATRYIDVMNEEFENLGVWMGFGDPYLTLADSYIEAIWHAFKEAEKKGLLYLGKYPIHICTRCETAVAYNEIEYGRQKDNSIFVKFPLKKKKNTFLIIWTTTPWTLPGNTGVMVHPEVTYQEIETSDGERWIIAKELVPKIMSTLERGYTAKDEFKGKKMEGWDYENPLAKSLKLNVKKGYKVILSARYVTTEDGTGLVHCAPGHGKEDYEVGKEYGIDAPCPVAINGLLTEEAGKYAGKKAREVDKEIIEDLKNEGFLVYQLIYEHDYPLCWRDKSPLLMVSQPQWFLKISEIQKKLIKENEKVNWTPEWAKSRMKAWLEGIGDWPVSRQRYWGTPLPIWYDEKTGERIIVGSLEELKRLSGKKKIDIHKPGIDEIVIKSPKTGKILKRVPEVLDVWFDSGVSSWAALGYPGDNKLFKKFWPADLNVEGPDQFRGWWNSQMILSEITFGKKPFDSIMMHGLVLDIGKKKMSKSLGNAISPADVISKHGRDYMRYYFAKFSKGENFSYDEKDLTELQKIVAIICNIDSFVSQIIPGKSKTRIEDRWIESKLNTLVKEVTSCYESYKFYEAVQKLENFILKDLSRTYIQIIRERSEEVFDVLNHIRLGITKLYAPIVPLLSEMIWQELRKKNLVKEESVHLSDWPKVETKKINEKLEKEFEQMLRVIELGMTARDEAKAGLRWPLASAKIKTDFSLNEELNEIIMRQLNVKSIKFAKGKELKVELDMKMTPELEAEGYSREFARKIQAERKNAGLKKGDMINLKVSCDNELKKMLDKNIHFLLERTNSNKIDFVDGNLPEKAFEFLIKKKKINAIFS
ncbi:MAG TPA: isoleucine--tRNA ligase [Candidatus Nanoarchaeia archaeon]|nr:isoleucine--tRNA ligase [Candidatus Nanoarchaeia archaeon]